MTWELFITTKSSGNRTVALGEDEAEAKEALVRARQEHGRASRSSSNRLATFEDLLSLPVEDITGIEIRERQLPRGGGASAGETGEPTITRDMRF